MRPAWAGLKARDRRKASGWRSNIYPNSIGRYAILSSLEHLNSGDMDQGKIGVPMNEERRHDGAGDQGEQFVGLGHSRLHGSASLNTILMPPLFGEKRFHGHKGKRHQAIAISIASQFRFREAYGKQRAAKETARPGAGPSRREASGA